MDTFAEVVRSRVGDQKEALRFEGRTWSWDEVIAEAAVRAALLQRYRPLDDARTQLHLGVLLQNVPDYVFWLLAAGLSGDAVAGINPTRQGESLAHDIAHVDCDLLITEPHHADDLAGIELPVPDDRVLDIESDAYRRLLDEHRGASVPDDLPDPAAIYLLLFSSGSTGAPKAVICTQGRMGRVTEALVDRISLHRESVTYLFLPLFHGHAIMMNLATAAQVGATIFMTRRFSASRVARDLREQGITFFNYVGRALSYILLAGRDPHEADNRLEVVFGSEASPAEVAEFRERFGAEVREGYGSSEGVVRIVPHPDAPPEALGLPASGVACEIRDPETGRECPRARFADDGRLLNAEEATGEIVAVGRGPVFEGYYDNPEAMAQRLRFGGEDFWTGDLGYRDEDGFFYFAGRSSDWVRVDGENFGVAPVERILVRFDAFSGVHCYGVADPRTGDLLMAAVTLEPGAAFDPDAFVAFLDAQPDLGTKWRPRFVRIIDEVPLTGSGKINKAPLRAQAWEADDVWWRPTNRDMRYRPLTDDDRHALRQEFVAAGRAHALPAASPVPEARP